MSIMINSKKSILRKIDYSHGHFVSLSFDFGRAPIATVVLRVKDVANTEKYKFLKLQVDNVHSIAASVDLLELATLIDIGDIIDCSASTRKGHVDLKVCLGAGFIQLRGQSLKLVLDQSGDDHVYNFGKAAVIQHAAMKVAGFHDGNLQSVYLMALQEPRACATMNLYESDDTRARRLMVVNILKLKKFVFVADARELKKDLGWGNISDGVLIVNRSDVALKLFFRSGVLDMI